MNTPFTLKQRGLKLALVAAFALGATVSGQSSAAESTATGTATVITPIAIATATNLEFGSFAPGAGGSVTVNTSGSRSASGAILSSVGTTPSAAKFDVTGNASSTYGITYTGTSTELSTGGTAPVTMAMATFSELTAGTATSGKVTSGTLGTTGAQSIYVGGTLTVGATQAAGTYTGSVKVQVEYN
jgi:spore coat protein U-like protein